ncbi:uncharacterized protein EI97DRAFT_460373 [Westerdykella ornata]|uniref:3-hydroxyisobutyrate dehydrogenase protein n=1 Tax=Westerdykella ornata TaxID=318751 RepID=A0A6A6JGA7_WESOR|nr:uncharacterized protein EI97DRAFT_460373 [Westerdykella ornata]KAF2274249.1 hypothetical protein EI97DRAFT_460373 [Westerdykella ornata]
MATPETHYEVPKQPRGGHAAPNHEPQTYAAAPRPQGGPVKLKGYWHMFDAHSSLKWGFPHFYRKPGYGYEKLGQYRNRDVLDRIWTGDYDDRYISSYDGKVSKLVVQAVDDIYDNTTNSTWRRTFVRNVSPFYLRLANWPVSHVDYARNGGPTSEDWPMIYVKWFFACIAISFVIGTPVSGEASMRNEGKYAPFPYGYIGYPKVARNEMEADVARGVRGNEANPIAERLLRPRYLCFLRAEGKPANLMAVDDYIEQYKTEDNLSYVFVAYTTEQFNHDSAEDMIVLHQIADAAARNAGVQAYWIGCSCLGSVPAQLQEDVYRICDVIRGAHSLAIAVGRPPSNPYGLATPDHFLQQWGKRIWTFPEVLLSPSGKDIKVYCRTGDWLAPIIVPKGQFPARVWREDAHIARQLIDHYEGNLILSQLELVTLAVECLHRRETTQYFRGDHSYALMGLLRIRPKIDPTDSAFQAFARLSLANGGNGNEQLLERLICVLPKEPNQPWHSMDDAYNAKLWDILPTDRTIAGIGEDDTIILDGCHAANVRWKSFAPVATSRIMSWKREFAKFMLRISGYIFWTSVALLAIFPAVAIPLFIYSLVMIALSPYLLRVIYLGKFWGSQGWFFGFEGYMDIDTIERQIFGARLGRMSWSAYMSPLSRHYRNEHNECVPLDPTTDENVRKLVERAKYAQPGDQRIFTLVDTGTMTATLFQAARPPICFILAGTEGGMQRALGCSYDWTTGTLYRETVLRFPTPIIDQMFRVPRVKLGFNRRQYPYKGLHEVGEARGKRKQDR